MRIAKAEYWPVSVPYTHRENSFQVNRDGVTDVVIRLTTDDGIVGWGESCSGANVESIHEALKGMEPIFMGRDPWNRDALHHDVYRRGIWNFREPTMNFAWAGIDMALWDICGKACGQPVYNLLGGRRQNSVDYFYYLSYSDHGELRAECRKGVDEGYTVFYRKVGVDIDAEVEALKLIRDIIGPQGKIRIDSNEAWTVAEATRNLDRLDRYDIDFSEQPVPADPIDNMLELKARTRVPLCSNEGLWRVTDVWNVIRNRVCDVLCFSSYWVGSLSQFKHLSHAAATEGLTVCKHTHGELAIAAAASHQVLLTLPRIVNGHQHTANMMEDDLAEIPIATSPHWEVPVGVGLCIDVDEDKVDRYHEAYREHGQFMPYDLQRLRDEGMP